MPIDPFLHALDSFVRKNRLITNGERILVAVSGGIDSIVLLDCLDSLRDRYGLEIGVAHFNHHLRGNESDEDARFTADVAKQRGLECRIGGADVHSLAAAGKCSVQEAARNARYAFLSETRKSMGFDKIATAHHADDNAETMLLNFFRGSGVRGLSGIPVFRRDLSVIRPLLFATREQIGRYAAARHLAYREDSSNARNDYTRNALRHRIVPIILEHCNPNLSEMMQRTAGLFGELDAYLDGLSDTLSASVLISSSAGTTVLDRTVLRNQPRFLQEYFLWRTAAAAAGSTPSRRTIEGMMDVCDGETGSICSIGSGYSFLRDRDRLLITKMSAGEDYFLPVNIGEEYHFTTFTFQSSRVTEAEMNDDPGVEYADGDAIAPSLALRTWRESDWFVPLGMNQKKKISDFFIDKKVPLHEKHRIPILTAGDSVVWICGLRLDERVKITPATKSIIKLEYTLLSRP